MSFRKFILIPIWVAFLAFAMQAIDQSIQPAITAALAGNVAMENFVGMGFGWIAFQAWACYFLAGCTIQGGIKAFISYILGCVASFFIMTMGGGMSSVGFFAFPVAVFFIVVLVICLERFDWTSFIPGLFIGAGAYFGFMSYVPGATHKAAFVVILGYCLFGLVWGFFTVVVRSAYEKRVSESSPAANAAVTA
jgi:hypothetical protein